MSRKGIGVRVKAKTNVATVRLASALGFQVSQEFGKFYWTNHYIISDSSATNNMFQYVYVDYDTT